MEAQAQDARRALEKEHAALIAAQRQTARVNKDLAELKSKKRDDKLVFSQPKPFIVAVGQQLTGHDGQTLIAVKVDPEDLKEARGTSSFPKTRIAFLSRQTAQMSGNAEMGLRQIGPYATFVADLRPSLSWKSVSGAQRYEVRIVDDETNLDVDSEMLSASSADSTVIVRPFPTKNNKIKDHSGKPIYNLSPNKVYRWYVEALDAAGNEIVHPTSRMFRFQTLSQSALDEVGQKRLLYANAPLLLGAFYIRHGALDEADSTLQKVSDNRDGRKLLPLLRKKRPSTPSH